jgi:putative PIN family toxin of toxin-antitoxin system
VKIVLDTNVLVAAFAAHGLCEAVYEACLVRHQIVLCEQILQELARHLPRVLRVSGGDAEEIVASVRAQALIVERAAVPEDACRDADDLPILGTLLAGDADCLVTGDQDLLDLREFHGKPILSPRGLHGLIS